MEQSLKAMYEYFGVAADERAEAFVNRHIRAGKVIDVVVLAAAISEEAIHDIGHRTSAAMLAFFQPHLPVMYVVVASPSMDMALETASMLGLRVDSPWTQPLDTWSCSLCARMYDPVKDGSDTAFEDLLDTYGCPDCAFPQSSVTAEAPFASSKSKAK